MNGEQNDEVCGKWWPRSLTVWGAVVTAVATVLPTLGPIVGLDITDELARQAGEQAVQIIQGLGGLAGILMTIYGRSRAAGPLARRDVSIRL